MAAAASAAAMTTDARLPIPSAMVAEPGSGSGPAGATPMPPGSAPTFGPFNPGETSPGRWAVQVQFLANFVNELVTKLNQWASNLGAWKNAAETRLTTTEQQTQRIDGEVQAMKNVVEGEIRSMKTVVESEFTRKQQDLESLSNNSQDAISTLAAQTRKELQNFHAGIMGEFTETRTNMAGLRAEASEAIQTLANSLVQARAEQLKP